MEATLNYNFKRQSKNHLDWLSRIIKSEKYFLADSYIVSPKSIEQSSRFDNL
ncbi:hypothetical protein [uncultured Psychroserpens sp.]|uniref:hypothetical protein n=1 Tax=uncultured Psychroserpens sp. TaxID=255436 RepID=UPI0026283EB6|nr:hypothetical protein [uncultured Psychroserpens sp.]